MILRLDNAGHKRIHPNHCISDDKGRIWIREVYERTLVVSKHDMAYAPRRPTLGQRLDYPSCGRHGRPGPWLSTNLRARVFAQPWFVDGVVVISPALAACLYKNVE